MKYEPDASNRDPPLWKTPLKLHYTTCYFRIILLFEYMFSIKTAIETGLNRAITQ